MATLLTPVVFVTKARTPTAVLRLPVVLLNKADVPTAVQSMAVVTAPKVPLPSAVLVAAEVKPRPTVTSLIVMSLAIAFVDPPKAIAVPPIVSEFVTKPELGRPVQLVSTPLTGVPSAGVTSTGEIKSAFVATAAAMLTNSVLISVPLTIFKGLPVGNASLVAKLVL